MASELEAAKSKLFELQLSTIEKKAEIEILLKERGEAQREVRRQDKAYQDVLSEEGIHIMDPMYTAFYASHDGKGCYNSDEESDGEVEGVVASSSRLSGTMA